VAQEKINLLVAVAQLYFFEGKSQQEIANIMGISRPTVSRLLAEAKELGIVHIEIRDPSNGVKELENLLISQFGLRSCHISQNLPTSESTTGAIGRLGAELLLQILRPGMTIGITWGSTVQRVVEAVTNPHVPGISVLQMVGSLGEGIPDVDGHEMARQLASKLEANYRIISAPPIVPTKEDRDRLVKLRTIEKSLSEAEKATVCLSGIGSLEDPDTSLHRSGHLSEEERLQLLRKGGVGHLIGRVIDAKGAELSDFNDRVVGVPLKTLRQAERSICVATGSNKAKVVKAALSGKLITDLVIDMTLAKQLIQK
jgi:deoxyribonucleoside regulator